VTPNNVRQFDDMRTARQWLKEDTLSALEKRFPLEDDNFRLELSDVAVDGPEDYGLVRQKKALMKDDQLRVPIKGTWKLVDKANNEILE